MIAINKSEKLHSIVWLQWSSLVLTVLICLSTVFLKQHSVLDIFGALALSAILYAVVYAPNRMWATTKTKQKILS
jgi:membrane-associated phospholipid phosphatase